MNLPQELLKSLENVAGFNRQAFEEVHAGKEGVTSIRINPAKTAQVPPHTVSALITHKVPWSSFGFYLSHRPSFTFDPLFHAGCYYVQEASSMFLEQALQQTADLSQPLNVLDLCAAPGGKSTHLHSLLSPNSLLISNEVIKSRASVLKQNIIKWGCENVLITNNDPRQFSALPGFFDVLVADAPCSGSGLFRKDKEAVAEWSTANVELCYGRQKRILADALGALKKNGILLYATCSYSREEDEDVADWLIQEMGMESITLHIHPEWNIVESLSPETKAAGYRFFPDKVKGEGFYLACFRKTTATGTLSFRYAQGEKVSAKEAAILSPWLQPKEISLIKQDTIYAVPSFLLEACYLLQHRLNVLYAGVAVGTIMKDKLIPEHALALSLLASATVQRTELDAVQAIRYLQKQELTIPIGTRGWCIVTHQQQPMGWVNVLPNRVNNYYPKELRILKQ